MSDDPFLAKLKEQAREAPPSAPPDPEPPPEPPAERERPSPRPAARATASPRHSYRDRQAVAFWQSEVAGAHIRRQISGDESISAPAYFAGLLDDSHRVGAAASLRGSDASLEVELLRNGACRAVTIVDSSAERLDYARARISEEDREKVQFEPADPISYDPPQPLGLVIASSALHRVPDPDAMVSRLRGWLAPGGMVYVDEFVGPDRFQWSGTQIEIVNQLLDSLPEELRIDLAGEPGAVKTEIGRPDEERFSRDHPSEAVASSRIREALDTHLEPVEVRPYGGAIFHQLFARIMGNFVRRPEVVNLILELDAILTERGVVESDYLWAAYRRPA